MTNLLCKACGYNFTVSERKIKLSDNDWFYCPECGSGNVEYLEWEKRNLSELTIDSYVCANNGVSVEDVSYLDEEVV